MTIIQITFALLGVALVGAALVLWPAYMTYSDPWEQHTPGRQLSTLSGCLLFSFATFGLVGVAFVSIAT